MSLSVSRDYSLRAKSTIAHGALTNSKRPSCFVKGVYPTHIDHGKGCYLYDVDGNRYIDFICGLGTNLIGYSNSSVCQAVTDQLAKGTTFSLSSSNEVLFAEHCISLIPCIEKVRILKSGSEGCSAAIRIARAFTGKRTVASEGYHGWHDEFTALTPPAKGVPPNKGFHIVNVEDVCEWDSLAAVIVEPVITDYSKERISYLRKLRQKCTESGAVLIFDETITAFRFPRLSFSKWAGIRPDLIIFGKALASGLPLSVVGGKKEVMDADYFVSSTFAGDTVAMAAAMETIRQLHIGFSVENMWNQAEKFQKDFNAIAPDLITIEGYPTRGVFKAEDLTKALFFQEACKAGILFGPSFFWCHQHQDEAYFVISACKSILSRIKNKEVGLEGEMPLQPFSQKIRDIHEAS